MSFSLLNTIISLSNIRANEGLLEHACSNIVVDLGVSSGDGIVCTVPITLYDSEIMKNKLLSSKTLYDVENKILNHQYAVEPQIERLRTRHILTKILLFLLLV